MRREVKEGRQVRRDKKRRRRRKGREEEGGREVKRETYIEGKMKDR